jgi:hypothetical protein
VTVQQGSGVAMEAGFVGALNFSTTRTGHLDATVDWGSAANDVDVAITRGTCTLEQFEANQCTFLAFSVSETAKPERIRAENVTPGAFTLLVENVGPGDETFSYQLMLTPTTASGAAPPTSSSRREEPNPLGQKRTPRGFVPLP